MLAVLALMVLASCGPTEPVRSAASPTTFASSTTAPVATSTSTSTVPVVPTTTWIPVGVDCSSQPMPRWDTEPETRPTPEAAVRWWADQPLPVTVVRVLVLAGDEIRRVGDPAAASPTYVSVREGVPVATFGLRRGVDGWRATPFEGCRRDLP